MKNKGNELVNKVLGWCKKGGISRYEDKWRLLESCVMTSMMYGSEIMGQDVMGALDVVVNRFVKQGWGLSKIVSTPILRHQFAFLPISFLWGKKVINFVKRVSEIPENKWVKVRLRERLECEDSWGRGVLAIGLKGGLDIGLSFFNEADEKCNMWADIIMRLVEEGIGEINLGVLRDLAFCLTMQ